MVAETAGRIDAGDFARAVGRADGRRMSVYDAAVLGAEPLPGRRRGGDPVLDAMTAPLTAGMLAHYRDTLGWLPDRRYQLLNRGGQRRLGLGRRARPAGGGRARWPRRWRSTRSSRVLVAHGATDLVTPYFASELILRQLPAFGPGERLRLAVYRGGHMFYLRDDARAGVPRRRPGALRRLGRLIYSIA